MASIQKLLEQMKASGAMPSGADDVPDLVGDFESAGKEPTPKDEVSKVD
jgi:hypothetical protein